MPVQYWKEDDLTALAISILLWEEKAHTVQMQVEDILMQVVLQL